LEAFSVAQILRGGIDKVAQDLFVKKFAQNDTELPLSGGKLVLKQYNPSSCAVVIPRSLTLQGSFTSVQFSAIPCKATWIGSNLFALPDSA
jgi:hypothetical protein